MSSRGKRFVRLAQENRQILEDDTVLENLNNQSTSLDLSKDTKSCITEETNNTIRGNDILQRALQSSFLFENKENIDDILPQDIGETAYQEFPVLENVQSYFVENNIEIVFEEPVEKENPRTKIFENKVIFEDIPNNDARSNEGDPDFEPNEEHFSSDSECEELNEPEVEEERDLTEQQEVTNSESDIEMHENEKGKKRRRKPDKGEWSREKTRIRRMAGEEYLGYTRNRDGQIFHKQRTARAIGPTCTSSKCLKYKNRFCRSISEEERNQIFCSFWKRMNWDQRKIYVVGLIKMKSTERKYVQNFRRSITYDYFLQVAAEKKQVCKKMFLSTLGVNEAMVSSWCKQNENGITPAADVSKKTRKAVRDAPRPKTKKENGLEEQSNYVKKFFAELTKMPAHYCRKDSTKQYLEYNFESKASKTSV